MADTNGFFVYLHISTCPNQTPRITSDKITSPPYLLSDYRVGPTVLRDVSVIGEGALTKRKI